MSARNGRSAVMTIGALARRTGVPVKMLREYEDAGLIYTVGRSAGNYRLFDEEALWCVGVIGTLRALGLTLNEIRQLTSSYLGRPEEPIGPHLAILLRAARTRTDAQIAELQRRRQRIEQFETDHAGQLAGSAPDFRADDPHFQPARA
ncbi:MAG TPA: MerR family transcriptional regulator [Pseudonocardiaceae bacterium]|nr:MerR family transcriptional regulator [Pseudonocardiaceae bacterium]